MNYQAALLSLLPILLFTFCSELPEDPELNPEDAKAIIRTFNDYEPGESISVNAGTSAKITYDLFLRQFIDSITVLVSSGEDITDTSITRYGPFNDQQQETMLYFHSAGTRVVIVRTYNHDGSSNDAKLSLTVKADVNNQAPHWVLDTIEFLSGGSIPTARDLSPYITDPESDPIIFAIIGNNSDFSISKTSLSSLRETKVGDYTFTVTGSDGNKSDNVIIKWSVFTRTLNLTWLVDDSITMLKNTATTFNPMKNDTVIASHYLCYVSQGEHGFAYLKNGYVYYTPETDFIGKDKLTYVVNAMDTAYIFISVVGTFQVGNISLPVDNSRF